MNFRVIADELKKAGFTSRKANAKIAHDIVLKAIEDAGFHDHVTIKGGVVMSGMTDAVRRATIDMDFDFLGYSLGDTSIRRFVQRLNRVSKCEIRIEGEIQELKQRDYKGKRIGLVLTDGDGRSIKTKVDIGVHANKAIEQVDFRFKVVDDDANVVLLVNPKEQMFVEKLKTLLRLGIVSTRCKDVYDLFYLSERVDTGVLKEYLRIYIYDDNEMFENNAQDIENRLMRIFASKVFLRRLSNPANAWLDETAENVAHSLLDYIREL
jgi:predicted nucleotidyltransferase component of viral defense system